MEIPVPKLGKNPWATRGHQPAATLASFVFFFVLSPPSTRNTKLAGVPRRRRRRRFFVFILPLFF